MPPIYPSEPYDYARALWFEEYMDDGFARCGRSRCILRSSWQPLLAGKPEPMSPPEAAGKAVDKEFPAFWTSRARARRGEFLVGEACTIAEYCDRERPCELAICRRCPARNRWPRLRTFLDRMPTAVFVQQPR